MMILTLLWCTDISWILQRIEIHGEGKKVKISQRECISIASQISGVSLNASQLRTVGLSGEGEEKKKKPKISRFLSFRNAALDCVFSLFPFLHTLLKKKKVPTC